MTWFAVTWGEVTPLAIATLSTVVELFKLSTSEAEEEGDSPTKWKQKNDIRQTIVCLLISTVAARLMIENGRKENYLHELLHLL